MIKNLLNSGIIGLFFICFPAQALFAASPVTVEKLNVKNNDIVNWTSETTLTIYSPNQLLQAIDGGAVLYIQKGCLSAGIQDLTGNDSTSAVCMVMDFGKDSMATSMFKEELSLTVGDKITNPGFPDSMVFVYPVISGVVGYAHFKNIYLEISVSGFQDQQKALQALNAILKFYQSKIVPVSIIHFSGSPTSDISSLNTVRNLMITRNPLSKEILLSFSLDRQCTFIHNVSVKIYTNIGKLLYVDNPVNLHAGKNQLLCNRTFNMSSGVYIFQLNAGDVSKAIPYINGIN